jgi:amino acid adenylation domain-containing protein
MSDTKNHVEPGLIAIVGMAGRFPGADNIEQFWRNLCAGVESITRFADSELEDSFSAEIRGAPNFVKARPILEGVEQFEPEFFGMYAREAELTDPQHRIFLECSWEALESAGYDPARYPGAIGVFAGSSINTYFLNNVCGERRTIEEFTSSYQVGCYPMLLGAGPDFLATRVSYKLDLKGPSVSLQTACSTSLLAVAQACQSLLLYQSDMALAGGVSISFPQKRGYQHLEGGMVSADGHCRPFDADASGTVFGSGAGVVLLKRWEDALADGDHVYALIRGCGINNDGASKVGFTAPSVDGQAAVIEMALGAAGVDARSIGYVECHGTATPLGDPIEIAGLSKAFAASTDERQFCALGSVKGNVGHLDAAAGVTGLIKTALSLQHGRLPPSLHYRRANPQIDFAATPFYVNAALTPWPAGPVARRAGVSAFGVGGTNVHVVLEEAPTQRAVDASSAAIAAEPPRHAAPQLLVLSARTETALAQIAKNLSGYLASHPELALADVAYTLQMGRRVFAHRSVVVARSATEAAGKLSGGEPSALATGVHTGPDASVLFLFPGQGSQYPNMGRDLYESQTEFRIWIDRCAEILAPLLQVDLRNLLYPSENAVDTDARLMATSAAQPAIFAVEYALAKLWLSWGIQPQAMLGHSVGEFVAATLAGVFSLEDALAVIAARGRLMQALPTGTMLAVRLPEADVQALLPPAISIAAVNSAALCVVSGPTEAIAALEQTLDARGTTHRRLHTSHAFHSAMVDPVIAPLRELLQGIRLSPPQIPCISCVTGRELDAATAVAPDYWARHAREPVRFADGLASACAGATPLFIEIGAGNALSTLALQATRGRGVAVITTMQGAARERNDADVVVEALGRAWIHGAKPDWNAVHGASRARVPLPTYPFERSKHWIDPPPVARAQPAATPVEPFQQPNLQDPIAMNKPSEDQHLLAIRATLAGIFEELSGEKPASDDAVTTFLEMGYDSLFLTQVAQKIQSLMKVKITFRQLLGDYATIPSLAAFLADKVPRVAAPPASPGLALPADLKGNMEALFRDQLQAMNQLINRQFEVLQGLGGASAPSAPGLAGRGPTPAALPAVLGNEDTAPPSAPSRFDVYKQRGKTLDVGISAAQREHIDALIAHYTQRTAGSKRVTAAHRAALADPRVAAGFRAELKEMVYPIVVAKSGGSKLYDVDGNEYIDLVNGYGQTAFGHAPAFVVEAVKAQLDEGFAIGPQAELAGKVAELFRELTGNERMTFCNTGSEAVMAAMRIARTVTGRDKIVIFNGDYHGQFDEVLVKGVQRAGAAPRSMPVAPGIPASAVENMIVLDYGSAQSLQWIRDNAADLAAVIVEPVQSRHPNLQPFEFLRELRRITEASGTAFVMDEVVTGFRVHAGGIQAIAGIRADLATYGKVVGGGLPVGILAGKAQFMDALDGGQWQYGDASYPEVGVTFFAGTFVRHPLVLSATWAVLNHLKEQGPALQETLSGRTAALVERLRQLFAAKGVATQIESYASWFYFNFYNEHPLATLFFYHLRARGIHIQDGFPCFLTTAHSDADIDAIYDAFAASLAALQAVGILAPQPVAAATAQRDVPLTENQLEIWLAAQLSDAASCAFNESVSLRMQGRLNASALQTALNQIVARHDALRATFSATGEAMHIAAPTRLEYPVTDLSDRPAAEAEKIYAELLAGDARTPFDLVQGPTFRCHLVKLGADSFALILTAHHIICDGWSINVIVSELAELYSGLCRDVPAVLAPAMAFSDYARAQAARSDAELAKTESYWLQEFREPPAPLALPTDRPRPDIKTFAGASHCRRIDAKLYQAVKKAGARQGSTLFVTLLAAFQALTGRLAGQQEVVVGVPTAGQSLLEDQILVGHCVNFLPIRGSWTRETTVAQFLSATAKRVLDAYEHQDTTFGTLVRKLALAREAGRLPLAEIQFNLERLADRMELPELRVEVAPNAKAYVNFDLFLNVIESADGLRLDCDYNTDLFDAATIDRWLDCYQQLLESIVADVAQPLVRAPWLSSAERTRLLLQVNATQREFPRQATIHERIAAQVVATPEHVAVRFADATLTYRELDRRANQLANHLRRQVGAQHLAAGDRLVGVSVERSLDMLVALLAVLKAGFAYVPLDPMHPAARLRYILGEAQVAALVSDGSENAALVAAGTPVIDVHRDAAAIAACDATAPAVRTGAEDLAYVIYTSGSTGLPKGVEIPHRAVVNLLSAMAREPGLASRDVFYAVTTISFDIAALELFLPLTVGASVVIAERDAVIDGFKLLKQLDAVGATAMQATPASWRLLLEAGFRARPGFKLLCGGEALPRELANRLLEGDGELWNLYGPTETTIWSSCTRITSGDAPITVGGPIANTQFYILDQNDQLVPTGVPGQLHIGGDGVARGYYQRDALTAEKFIGNPFAPGRLYRTGDLARWLPDGGLQLLGRIDHQIKLRGFRIELGEIESVLTTKGRLAAATVLLREDAPGAARLVAYYVQRPEEPREPAELRAVLAEDMPEYMIPSAWVRLDALPLSPNGKLDRAALPVPDSLQAVEEEFVPPTTATEIALTGIFREVLQLERVGKTADLLKLGADSIQLFQITARANRSGLKVTAKQLLQHRNAASLGALIDSGPASPASAPLPSLAQFQRNRQSGASSRR